MLLKYGRVQTIGEDGVKERNGKFEVSGAATGNLREIIRIFGIDGDKC